MAPGLVGGIGDGDPAPRFARDDGPGPADRTLASPPDPRPAGRAIGLGAPRRFDPARPRAVDPVPARTARLLTDAFLHRLRVFIWAVPAVQFDAFWSSVPEHVLCQAGRVRRLAGETVARKTWPDFPANFHRPVAGVVAGRNYLAGEIRPRARLGYAGGDALVRGLRSPLRAAPAAVSARTLSHACHADALVVGTARGGANLRENRDPPLVTRDASGLGGGHRLRVRRLRRAGGKVLRAGCRADRIGDGGDREVGGRQSSARRAGGRARYRRVGVF